MTPKQILITGASGCIGHYFTEQLIHKTDHELYILARNPAKLRFDVDARPGIHVVAADLREIDQYGDLLSRINVAILAATSWGGVEESYEINVAKTLALIERLDPAVCEQVLYFSTESILDQENQLLPEAGELGTDYIRTKYICFQGLEKLAIAPKITALFPTLVFGGDDRKPYSHLTEGFPQILSWLWLIRFLSADGSFHFMHGYDIAQVVCHLVDHPEASPAASQASAVRKVVLGNAPMTVNQTIREACRYFGKRIYFRVPLKAGLAEFFIRVFRIQVGPWDWFCIRYRHFVHRNPVSPATFGLQPYAQTLSDILKIYGFGLKG